MTEAQVVFDAMMVFTFAVAILDHAIAAHGRVSKPVRLMLLGGFCYTEGYLALTGQPFMALYVALNCFGIWGQLRRKS